MPLAVAGGRPNSGEEGAASAAEQRDAAVAHGVGPPPPRIPQRGGDWLRIDVDGGYLLFSATLQRLDAHCTRAGHDGCKADRTLRPAGNGRGGQGRPVGRQLAWLSLGNGVPTAADHGDLRCVVGGVSYHSHRTNVRTAFERLAATNTLAAQILAAERPTRAEEGREPASVP